MPVKCLSDVSVPVKGPLRQSSHRGRARVRGSSGCRGRGMYIYIWVGPDLAREAVLGITPCGEGKIRVRLK